MAISPDCLSKASQALSNRDYPKLDRIVDETLFPNRSLFGRRPLRSSQLDRMPQSALQVAGSLVRIAVTSENSRMLDTENPAAAMTHALRAGKLIGAYYRGELFMDSKKLYGVTRAVGDTRESYFTEAAVDTATWTERSSALLPDPKKWLKHAEDMLNNMASGKSLDPVDTAFVLIQRELLRGRHSSLGFKPDVSNLQKGLTGLQESWPEVDAGRLVLLHARSLILAEREGWKDLQHFIETGMDPVLVGDQSNPIKERERLVLALNTFEDVLAKEREKAEQYPKWREMMRTVQGPRFQDTLLRYINP